MSTLTMLITIALLLVLVIAAVHLCQRSDPVLRIFPILGAARTVLIALGPKLRQYLVANDSEERPFSRLDREDVEMMSTGKISQIAFGSRTDLVAHGHEPLLKYRTFPRLPVEGTPEAETNSAGQGSLKTMGAARQRRYQYRPASIVNISGMSFGALSGPAVETLNLAAGIAGCFQNSGEGGISDHHLHGGDLVFQIGSGYFGCRDHAGSFSISELKERLAQGPIKALEIKISQGAKPGLGGFLPGEKVTAEIARYRGITQGMDCASPPRHAEFWDADSLLDWVEYLADETGLPVGIKSAVGDTEFWSDLATLMARDSRGVDYIAIDGSEGGTGAAPSVFAESVGYPFRQAFPLVHREFRSRGIDGDVVFIGAGRLGLAANAARAFAYGADLVNVGRTAMLSMGCIQALKCHTGHCPSGVATQRPWLTRGIVPEAAALKVSNYLISLRKELFAVAEACGVPHPGLLTPADLTHVDGTPVDLRSTLPVPLTSVDMSA